MKSRNPFTKGHLNICPVKDITCKNCNYKGPFAKFCKSRNKRPSVNIVSDNHVITENCIYIPPESSCSENQETCGVINAWKENGQSDDDNISGLTVRTTRTRDQETFKQTVGMENDREMNNPVDSTSLVSFSKPKCTART